MEVQAQNDILIRAATPQDCAPVAYLLKTSGLPIDDIVSDLSGFLVAEDGGKIIGTVGIENFGDTGLLRSLAVAPPYRKQSVGERLYLQAIEFARAENIRRLYLLTTTASGYFASRGFVQIARDLAPEIIRTTEQFKELCPSSAIIMERAI